MVTTDSRARAALDTATQRVGAAVASAAGQVATALGTLASTSLRVAERDLLNLAQFELRRNAQLFREPFLRALRDKVEGEFAPRADPGRRTAETNWQTLSLVDHAEMEERMHVDRLGQAIAHGCEVELRDLSAYLGDLLPAGRADVDRHPLRPDVLGTLVYRSIEAVTREAEPRQVLAREFGRVLGKAMPGCYAGIVGELRSLGVRPAEFFARGVAGSSLGSGSGSGSGSGGRTGHATMNGGPSTTTGFDASGPRSALDAASTFDDDRRSTRSGGSASRGSSRPGGPASEAAAATRSIQADAALMSLLRRLTSVGGGPGEPASASTLGGFRKTPSTGGTAFHGAPSDRHGGPTHPAAEHASGSLAEGPSLAGPLMAVNLIRAHRDELVKASTGQLDHMVIDVVGSLFDQILSDPRVPPQMARQIARLQLPVLRVALADSSFFSSRRHPVRRFVNRMASLACAFDDFDAGPGLQLIERVRELVQEIVDGDFDRIDLYAAQLTELERFIGEQAARSSTAQALDRKESELRLQQRCRLQLRAALAPVSMPLWLRDFLEQVWSQAIVVALATTGKDPERAHRYRRAGRDLVLSIQPKNSLAMRKRFLMQLPPLMKDLNDGMRLVGWPEAAQRHFFAALLPAQAESMKLAAISELEHNLLAKQLEAVFAVAGTETTAGVDERTVDADAPAVEPRFTAEEAKAVGLVPENTVDWSSPVALDIDLSEDLATARDTGPTEPQGIDIPLDLGPAPTARLADGPEPTAGAALMDHLRLGHAYEMHLKTEWQKVRLTHVSAGRGFFVFSGGKTQQETISMTARMLARMCGTGRLRAFETAQLMERATHRARRQLAALLPAGRAAGA